MVVLKLERSESGQCLCSLLPGFSATVYCITGIAWSCQSAREARAVDVCVHCYPVLAQLCTVSLVLHGRVKAQEKRERSMSVFTVTRF